MAIFKSQIILKEQHKNHKQIFKKCKTNLKVAIIY